MALLCDILPASLESHFPGPGHKGAWVDMLFFTFKPFFL